MGVAWAQSVKFSLCNRGNPVYMRGFTRGYSLGGAPP